MVGKDLIERVDGKKLDAGRRIDLLSGIRIQNLLHHVLSAQITVAVGIAQGISFAIERHIIDGPGVHRTAFEVRSRAEPLL